MKLFRIFIAILSVFSVTFTVNLLTPVYSNYTALEGKGTGVLALVFSVYIIGMFLVLIFFGGLSDIWGRRNTLFLGQFFSLISILVIYFYPTLLSLFMLRFLAGIAIGLTINTATALLAQLFTVAHKESLTSNWVSGISTLGFGSGALFTGFYVMQNHNVLVPPTSLWAIGLSLISLIGILFLPNLKLEKQQNTSIIRFPFFPQKSIYLSLSLGLGFSSTAVMISVLPVQLKKFNLFEYNGIIFFAHTIAGVIGTILARYIGEKKSLYYGYIFCPLGTAFVIYGSLVGKLFIIYTGATLIGFSAWGLFYFAILSMISIMGGIYKARAVAGLMFIAYIGFGLPVVGIGFLADIIGIDKAVLLFVAFFIIVNFWLAIKTLKITKGLVLK